MLLLGVQDELIMTLHVFPRFHYYLSRVFVVIRCESEGSLDVCRIYGFSCSRSSRGISDVMKVFELGL